MYSNSNEGTPSNELKPIFWHLTKDGEPKINLANLIDYLSINGYRNYQDPDGKYSVVLDKDNIIVNVEIEDVKHYVKYSLRELAKREDVYSKFAQRNYITENTLHLLDKIPLSNFNPSTKETAYFYYENGVIAVTSKGIRLIPYKDFHGKVWKQQIIKRAFKFEKITSEDCEFNTFLKNITGNDLIRYKSLLTVIGYLLDPFKDSSISKAVILVDQNADFSGKAHGGTGKSMLAKALGYITSMAFKDGKKINNQNIFANDDIKPWTRLIYYDDLNYDFNLTQLYSMITGPMVINIKFKPSYTIPFSLSPKIFMSSNYMVLGGGGDTEERRRIDVEIAPYYKLGFSPNDEFGHNLFDDWDESEWHACDRLMVECVRFYKKFGLIDCPKINLEENKLIMTTNADFIQFMDDNITFDSRYDKQDLLKDLKDFSPVQHSFLSQQRFKTWIDLWATTRGYKTEYLKSNGKYFVIISKN